MRIVHLSTVDIRGGAARSAYRLHRGLLNAGTESSMLVKQKFSKDDSVTVAFLEQGLVADETIRQWDAIHTACIHERRTAISNTYFSLPDPAYDLSLHPLIAQADIIHLHWVSNMAGPLTVAALRGLGKPLVWTLHDQRTFTGGCHFSAGCCQFETDWAQCPQLSMDRSGLTAAVLADSVQLLGAHAITVVSPSHWLADCARRSVVFRSSRVEVIPNGLNTTVFRPIDRATACNTWRLNPEVTYLLFGAFDWAEKRKGFEVLIRALKDCLRDSAFAQRVTDGSIKFLCFGQNPPALAGLGMPVKFLGQINSDEQMAAAYSAAAVVLLPSLEDNLPNMAIEALCCGTPVIAQRVGGVPEVIEHGVTGLLAAAGDSRQFAEAIRTVASDPHQREVLSANCRRDIPSRYSLERQAMRYRALYDELMRGKNMSGTPEEKSIATPALMLPGGPRLMKIYPKLLKDAQRRHRKKARRLFFRRLREKLSWKSTAA